MYQPSQAHVIFEQMNSRGGRSAPKSKAANSGAVPQPAYRESRRL